MNKKDIYHDLRKAVHTGQLKYSTDTISTLALLLKERDYLAKTRLKSESNKNQVPEEEKVTAKAILEEGISVMKDRAATYDKAQGERSMRATVEAFNALTGLNMSEEQGWLFMVCLKASRSQQGVFKEDNYVDGAAYFGLYGECASQHLPDAEDPSAKRSDS